MALTAQAPEALQSQRAATDSARPWAPRRRRTAHRYRLAAWSTGASLCARALALLVLIVGIAVAAPYLGPERLGTWMALSAAAMLLLALDCGVGNALLNRIARLEAAGDRTASERAVAGGVALLIAMGAAAALVVWTFGAATPWQSWLGITEPALVAESRQAGAWLAVVVGLNIAASGSLRVLAGQQRGHRAHWISCAASVAGLLAVLFAASQEADIGWLLLASSGLPSLVTLWLGLRWMPRSVNWSRWGRQAADEAPHLLRDGKWFFALQLGSVQGPASVAALALAARLFQFASQPFAAMNNALWPGYADAAARGDHSYLVATLRRSLLTTLLGSAVIGGLLFLVAQPLLARWSSGTVSVSNTLLLAVAACTVAESAGHAFAVYLNGRGVVRAQLWVVLAFCAVALPLKFLLGSAWGAVGVVAATLIAFMVAELGLYATLLRGQAFPPRGPAGGDMPKGEARS